MVDPTINSEWMYSIFNKDKIMAQKEQWTKEAEEAGMTLTEYLESINPLKQESRWVPCSERLPEAGEYIGNVAKYYLVQNEYGDMFVARYTHSKYWERIYQIRPIADKIVAWRPLPEPYKAERSDI